MQWRYSLTLIKDKLACDDWIPLATVVCSSSTHGFLSNLHRMQQKCALSLTEWQQQEKVLGVKLLPFETNRWDTREHSLRSMTISQILLRGWSRRRSFLRERLIYYCFRQVRTSEIWQNGKYFWNAIVKRRILNPLRERWALTYWCSHSFVFDQREYLHCSLTSAIYIRIPSSFVRFLFVDYWVMLWQEKKRTGRLLHFFLFYSKRIWREMSNYQTAGKFVLPTALFVLFSIHRLLSDV